MSEIIESFRFSEETIQRRKKLIIAVMTPVVVLMPTFVEAPDWKRTILFTVVAAFLILVILTVECWWIFRQLRAMSLEIAPVGLTRHGAKIAERINWIEITSVRKMFNRQGLLRSIECRRHSGRPVALWGFEPMAKVADLIEAHLPKETQVKIKRSRVDWESPLVVFVYSLAVGVVLIVVRRSGGRMLYDNVNALVQLFVGIFFFMYGPLSRQNSSWRKAELILGTVIMVCGLAQLLLH